MQGGVGHLKYRSLLLVRDLHHAFIAQLAKMTISSPSLPLCLFWVRGLRYHCAFSFPNHLRVSVRLMKTEDAA